MAQLPDELACGQQAAREPASHSHFHNQVDGRRAPLVEATTCGRVQLINRMTQSRGNLIHTCKSKTKTPKAHAMPLIPGPERDQHTQFRAAFFIFKLPPCHGHKWYEPLIFLVWHASPLFRRRGFTPRPRRHSQPQRWSGRYGPDHAGQTG